MPAGGGGEGADSGEDASGAATMGGGAGGFLGTLFGAGSEAGNPSSPKPKGEKEVEQAAALWQQAAAALLILACGALVGTELAPSQQQANAIATPLVRIAMRHMDPLRRGSADLSDAVTAAAMFALYVQAIMPAFQAKQAAKKVQSDQQRRAASAARAVPIERAPVVATTAAPGPAAMAGPDDPAGRAGRYPDAVRNGHQNDDRRSAAGAVPVGEALLAEYRDGSW